MAEPKRYITSGDLKKHNIHGDMWISIQGKVYDVSDWAKDHPGGDLPLLNLAGQDVTDAFMAYHPGTAWKYLDKFFNGYHLEDYSVSEVSKDYRKLLYEITRMGLFEKKEHVTFLTLCAMAMLFCMSIYGVLCCESNWAHMLSGAFMGLMWVQCGWIGHDSGHSQIMPSRKLNNLVFFLSGNCLSGVSCAWWKRFHNAHHIACNNLEFDPDVQNIPYIVVSSKSFNSLTSYYLQREMKFDAIARFFVSYQHWTYYIVMFVARTKFYAESFLFLLSGRKECNRVQEFLGIMVFWVWYPFIVSCLPNWGERFMFVMLCFSMVGIQNAQFGLNHLSSSVYVGHPMGNDWFEKQTSGTLNITSPPWMDWFHGGIQFQIEHHLFPRLPRCNFRKVSPLVKELCKKHGLAYKSLYFWEANALTIRTLKTTALQARDLTIPVPKKLVPKTFNTHG